MTSLKTFPAIFLCCLLLIIINFPASAQTSRASTSEQSTETFVTENMKGCDFLVDFPSSPLISRNCVDTEQDDVRSGQDCSHKAEFTKVYIGQATIEVTAICKPASADDLQKYSEQEMKATLTQRAEKNEISTYDTYSGTADDGTKFAIMTGAKEQDGNADVIMTQIWISEKSFFSISGVIQGISSDKIDRVFSRIMRSVRRVEAE